MLSIYRVILSIYIEIEIGVICCVYEEKQINLIQDMYSPMEKIDLEKKQITTMTNKQKVTDIKQIREKINVKDIEGLNLIDVEIIEESIESDNSDKINEYLQSIIGEKLTKDKQTDLVNIIGLTDSRGRQQKSFSIMKSYIDDNTNFTLSKKRTKNERYWIVNQK